MNKLLIQLSLILNEIVTKLVVRVLVLSLSEGSKKYFYLVQVSTGLDMPTIRVKGKLQV